MTVMLMCGAGLGLGLWLLLVGARPPRPALHTVLDTLTRHDTATPALRPSTPPTRVQRVGSLLGQTGHGGQRLRRDLTLLGLDPDRHAGEKILFAAAGALLPAVLALALHQIGLDVAWHILAAAAILFAALGFTAPDLIVRRRAQERRAAIRHGLAACLNLVRILLAGGAGVDSALTDAATIGHGPVFTHLRHTLTTATITRTTPWAALARLGDDLDIAELTTLASTMTLAGSEGARVRATLAARSSAMRTAELASAEADAHAATERATLPVGLLMAAFLVLITYPALAAVLDAL